MKLLTARRLATVAVTALAGGVLVAGVPAQGATGNLGYSCRITDDYKYTFTFNQDTSAPAVAYVGKKYVYTARTDFPEAGVGFARALGVAYIDGAIDATVYVNGAPITIHAPIPRTNVPTNTNQMSLTATGVLPARATVGSVVYKPGDILFTVNAHRADKSSLFELKKGKCTMPANTTTLDAPRYAKSPSAIRPTASYKKSTKKVTAGARLTSASGVGAAGKVTFTLYKGSSKLKAVAKTLSGGTAKAGFTGIKAKGSYKVVTTYAGSSALNGSTASKSFTVR